MDPIASPKRYNIMTDVAPSAVKKLLPAVEQKKKPLPMSTNTAQVMDKTAQIAQDPLSVVWLKPALSVPTASPWLPSVMQPGLKSPTPQTQQTTKNEYQDVKKQSRKKLFDIVEQWGTIKDSHLRYALEGMDKADKEDILNIIAESNATVEAIDIPAPKNTNMVEDVLWWALSSAKWLLWLWAESGLLDRPAEYLANSKLWDVIRSGARTVFGDKAVSQYQSQEQGKPFSQVAAENVAWDPNSAAYKNTKLAWDVTQLATWLIPLVKEWSKAVAKQTLKSNKWKILDIVKEGDTVADKKAALRAWRLIDKPTGIKWWFSWSKELVQPSKRTLSSVETISKEIPNASTKPVQLFNQVKGKISEIWSSMSNELKQIWVKNTNLSFKSLTESLDNVANEISDISKAKWNQIRELWKRMAKAENANDYWNELKKLDSLIPENIKSWKILNGKDQYIYDAWRTARTAWNDMLEEIASKTTNTQVKQWLKTMSDLYHASWQIEKKIGTLTKWTEWAARTVKWLVKKALTTWAMWVIWWAAWYKAGKALWF